MLERGHNLKWNFSADLMKVALIPDFSTIDTYIRLCSRINNN